MHSRTILPAQRPRDDRRPRGDRALARSPRRRLPPTTNLEALEPRTLLSGPPTSLPQHYPNIRIAEVAYNPAQIGSFEDQLLAHSVDLVVTDAPYLQQAVHAAAPATPQMIYTNISNISHHETNAGDVLADWFSYASAHGLDPESVFYHASHALPDGTPAGGRVLSKYGNSRYAMNPTPAFRQWIADYELRYLNANPLAAGLFVDNSTGSPLFNYGQGDIVESLSTYSADYGAAMQAINQAIAPRWAVMNVAGGGENLIPANPAYYEESLIRPLAQDWNTFENIASWVADWQSEVSPAPYGIIDSNSRGGSPTDPRTQIATLAEYYLIADPQHNFLNFFAGENPESSWTEHWSPAAAYNVGQPTGTWSVFATGKDPSDAASTYKVYQRTYSNALVLYKPLSFNAQSWGSGTTADGTATTHQLGGTYRPLQADGSLGAPVTSVTLRNGEGAILIKDSGSTVPPQPPVATNDTYTTPQDTTLNVATPGLLANDSDPPQPLTATLVAGPANGTLTLNPNGSFTYTPKSGFAGADSFTYRDSDGTLQSNTANVALMVTPPTSPPTSTGNTLFSTTATPNSPDDGPDSPVEIGVQFQADVAGTVTGIRFYKSSANTGTHIGNLWDSAGHLLATATFTGETASGWQQVNFANPVPIQPNTIYVASYHTNVGHYADDDGDFSVAHSNGHLTAPADGASGPNGVYWYGTDSGFPNTGYLKSNYWVDVVFLPSTGTGAAAPAVAPVATQNSTGAGAGATAPTDLATSSVVPLTADPTSVPAGPMARAKSRPGSTWSQPLT